MSDSFEILLRRLLLIALLVWIVYQVILLVRSFVRKRGYMAFMYCLNQGDLEEAKDLFLYLVDWSPKSLGSWPVFRMAFLDLRMLTSTLPLPYERLRDFFDSLAQVAVNKAPSSPYSFLLAAGLASQQKPGSDECRNYLTQALALANRNLDVYMWAGEIQMIAGYYRDSARYFSIVQRIAKLNRDEHTVCQANIALAHLHSSIAAAHRLGNSPSIQHWSKSIALEKNDIDRVTHSLMQANEYARCGNNVAALEVLYKAYSACPEELRTPALVILLRPCVTLLLRQNEPDMADKFVERAKESSVQDWAIEATRVALHRGDINQAQELISQARDNDDGTEIFALRLALLYGEMGQEAQKLALLEQADRKAEKRMSPHGAANNNISDVTVNTIVFFPFEPNLLGMRSVASELAAAYQERGRYDDAVATWIRALRYDVHNPVKMVQLAKALELDGQHEEAIKRAHQAETRLLQLLVEAPDCPLLHLALGDVYRLDGDSVQAALHYKLVSCEPHLAEARRAAATLDIDQADLLESLAKHVKLAEDSESRRQLATFLALHGPEQESGTQEAQPTGTAESDTPGQEPTNKSLSAPLS